MIIKKTYIVFIPILLLLIWYFIGGYYLSYDSSNPLKNKKVTFKKTMLEVSPIPNGYMNPKIRKKYHRVLISDTSHFIKTIDSSLKINITPFDTNKELRLSDIIYEKNYGFFGNAFKSDATFLLLKDNEGKEYVLYEGFGYERFH